MYEIGVQPFEKNKIGISKTQSIQKLQPSNSGYKIGEKKNSLKKLKTKPDDFGDFKLNLLKRNEPKMSSYKSQQVPDKKS